MEITVREGQREDVPQVLSLIKELAEYEKEPEAVVVTEEELTRDGFGENPIYGLFVAEANDEIVGIALYYEKYSTWKGRCIFLEDMVVRESFRGKGIGAQLFEEVIEVAKVKKARRMEWQVLDWNEPAIRFYKRYNAHLDPEWINGKFVEEQIRNFRKGQ